MLELDLFLLLTIFQLPLAAGSDLITFGFSGSAVGRSGWGWGDAGIGSFLDKIASLLTFLSFGVFLLNLLLNALLLGSTLSGFLFPTVTGTATATGGGGGGGGTGTGTATATGGTSTATATGGTSTATATGTGGTPTTPAPIGIAVTGGGAGTGGIGIGTGGITITGAGAGDGGIVVGIGRKMDRVRRSTLTLPLSPVEISSLMSSELVELIEAVVNMEEDCLPHFLCLSNKRAVTVQKGFQYLMPICSLGLSYLRERRFGRLLPYMNAIYQGIMEDNCSKEEVLGSCRSPNLHQKES